MRPIGSPHELEQRRYRALALLKEGLSPVEVAQRLGVDRRSVRRWKSAARHKGREALRAQPAPGQPSRISARQRQLLRRALERGAEAAGFPTPLWTYPRVADWIHQRFGVRFHPDHVRRLLHVLGFTPQKPARLAAQRLGDPAITPQVKNKVTVHPAWPSFTTARGREIRYGDEACPRTIDILHRFAAVPIDPKFTEQDTQDIARAITKIYPVVMNA